MSVSSVSKIEVIRPSIPAEVADTIERLRAQYEADSAQIVLLATRTGGGLHNDTVTLQTIPFDTLLAALVNGYEREMTVEERKYAKLRDIFNAPISCREDESFNAGIECALSTLGIVISGINGEADAA